MNPARPSLQLLRKIARILADHHDPEIRRWVDEMSRKHSSVSIVKTYRLGRLCGYEVWRHLRSSTEDPKRRKARLWFGLRPKGKSGHEALALKRAKRAKKWLAAMSERELHTWWADQQRERREAVRGVRAVKHNGKITTWEAHRIVDGRAVYQRFNIAHWETQLGYAGAARVMAENAARRLHAMTKDEVHLWWAKKERRRGRPKMVDSAGSQPLVAPEAGTPLACTDSETPPATAV
jgi:hypothetical protein